MSLILPRRQFLAGLAALVAAPAVVRAASLMPISAKALSASATLLAPSLAGAALDIGDFISFSGMTYQVCAIDDVYRNGRRVVCASSGGHKLRLEF